MNPFKSDQSDDESSSDMDWADLTFWDELDDDSESDHIQHYLEHAVTDPNHEIVHIDIQDADPEQDSDPDSAAMPFEQDSSSDEADPENEKVEKKLPHLRMILIFSDSVSHF